MTNCYSTGFISGSEVMENGALSAWLGGSGAVITNCWSSATVSGIQNDEKYLARFNSATFNNCYSVNGTPLQATVIDYDAVESGELCYMLNGNQEEIAWYQTLGEDEFPTFLPGHMQVYANGDLRCDGTFMSDDVTYSNTSGSDIPDHQFVDGFCKVCHQQDPDFPFLDVFANADHDTTDGYTTSIKKSSVISWSLSASPSSITSQTVDGIVSRLITTLSSTSVSPFFISAVVPL